MNKRSTTILSLVFGMILFLLGCSKSNNDTLAFVGDESDMKDCYELYPANYFPSAIPDSLRIGMFPPDIVGEYEIHGVLQDGTYASYNQSQQQYVPVQPIAYRDKYMYFIIENQVNGMARIKFAIKNNYSSNYNKWFDVDAYIYGNVFSNNYKDVFMICYENVENSGDVWKSYNGNIITGKINSNGLFDIDYWTIYKDVQYSTLLTGVPQEGGYAHYHTDGVRKVK